MHYGFIKELLNWVEVYEQTEKKEMSISRFIFFMQQESQTQLQDVPLKKANSKVEETIDSVISKYVIFLYRYARMHLKQALQQTAFKHYDDFVFCMVLFPNNSITKSELIEKNIQEKTTGIEIINRLLKEGFIQQTTNETDKRSKKVSLTKKGNIAIYKSLPAMMEAVKTISGNLTNEEKKLLSSLLLKLHLYHLPLFTNSST